MPRQSVFDMPFQKVYPLLVQKAGYRCGVLVGLGVYNLSREAQRQISLDDLLEDAARREEAELQELLAELEARYGLDFAGHLEQIYQADTLHKTVEYMRKHS